MTVEYRKLVDWNPKKGDVFRDESGNWTVEAVSNTHAKGTKWLADEQPELFASFGKKYRLVSRADTEEPERLEIDASDCRIDASGPRSEPIWITPHGEPITPGTEEQAATDDLHRAMREIAADLRGLSTKLDYATSRLERARAAKPKRETMTLYGCKTPDVYGGETDDWSFSAYGGGTPHRSDGNTHRITLPLIDGRLPAGEYRNADGDVITVEELK